jgi:hypothetical protein
MRVNRLRNSDLNFSAAADGAAVIVSLSSTVASRSPDCWMQRQSQA